MPPYPNAPVSKPPVEQCPPIRPLASPPDFYTPLLIRTSMKQPVIGVVVKVVQGVKVVQVILPIIIQIILKVISLLSDCSSQAIVPQYPYAPSNQPPQTSAIQ
jgi:hypothetical protein